MIGGDRTRSHRGVLVGDDEVVADVVGVWSDVEDRAHAPVVDELDDPVRRERIQRRRRKHLLGGLTRLVRAEEEEAYQRRERSAFGRRHHGGTQRRPPHSLAECGVGIVTEKCGDSIGVVLRRTQIRSE